MLELITSLALALGAGLFIGLEREKSAYREKTVSLFSLRAYVFLGIGGWLAWYLGTLYGQVFFAGALAIMVLTVLIGYAIGWKQGFKPSLTSELSALFTIAIGALASPQPLVAIILMVLTALDLTLKTDLQELALGLERSEYLAAIKFITISAIVLPLLPDTTIDPWGLLNPRSMWLMVVLISAIGFFGYLLTRIIGKRNGTIISGILGGLVSSTAVTMSLARQSRSQNVDESHKNLLVSTTLAANGMMYFRVLIWGGTIFPAILPLIIPPLLVMLLPVVIFLYTHYKRYSKQKQPKQTRAIPLESPLRILPALKFALLFFLIIVITYFAQILFGNIGLYLTAFFSGFSDIDPISLQLLHLADSGSIVPTIAATGIMIAVLVNTFSKGLIGLLIGDKQYGRRLTMAVVALGILGSLTTLLTVSLLKN